MDDAGLRADSRAVLIGVSVYEYAEFPPIRAARNSLQAMQSLLADPALCGWRPELITVIANPISAADLADRIADLAETTTGVLLLYYVGHGVLSTRGELCLTVTSTRPNRPKITGLPWETLADVLRSCPARTRLVILDCCFSGQAIEALSADGDLSMADITHVGGVYTLTATTRNRTAHVPPPGQQDTACTSFTGELEDLIRSGIPGKPSQLTFGDIYPELQQRLRTKGLPAPSQRGTDTAHQFPFTANPAARAEPAERIAPPVTAEEWAAAARASIAGAVVAAERLADEAQAQAGPFTGNAVTRTDDHGNSAGETLQTVRSPVLTDQPRVIRLLDDAIRAALAITSERGRAQVLARVAQVLAASDPDRAERIARSITLDLWKAEALADIAQVLTG